jgi:nitrogen fixation/metabolism regulation signal transduction histidine kinase
MTMDENVQPELKTPRRPYKRQLKNLIIHRPMQREFSFMLIALFMVTSLAVAWVIHQTIRDATFGGALTYGKINPSEILYSVSYTIITRVTMVLILTLIIIGAYSIVFLHRVAGPIYRCRQTLLKVNRGEMPPDIKLREEDFFHDMAYDINIILRRLRSEKDKIARLKDKMNNMQQNAPSDDIRHKVEELKVVLDSFSKI